MFPWSIRISMKQPNFCKKCAYVLLCEAVSLVGHRTIYPFQNGGLSWSGQNVSNNFVKMFSELYLFSMDLH